MFGCLFRLAFRLALFGLLLALILLIAVLAGVPSRSQVRRLAGDNPGKTAVMAQREQEARLRGRAPRSERSWVPLWRVSRHLVHALLSSEDQRFFGHAGVDWDAIRKSAETNWERGRLARGGSTITQQLAKNLFFSTKKTLLRKLEEFLVARWLEEDLSKRRILELYLNVIEWGDGIYGCEAAARRYYGKSAADLDEREAAGLAAMIPNPRRINPRVSPARHERATRRVLWLMASAGYIRRDLGGYGAEPPAEPADEVGPEPVETEPAASPALDVETTPAPEPTPTPDPTEPAEPEPAATLRPEAEPTPTPTPTPGRPPLRRGSGGGRGAGGPRATQAASMLSADERG
ncbi:MAG: monofunctional biosynthetic peptidoglycan transglycosylase [Vicinamibacteria bacterium]